MKNFYYTLFFLSLTFFVSAQVPTVNSPEVGITAGTLSVSLTGGAIYSIPIAVPPSINGVLPQVSLTYNSQSGNGTAGYGWNISGVSAITRIPSTKFHDGKIDPVDFNDKDRFALDGQRLMPKNGGSYYVVGAGQGVQYETENFSNVKIYSQNAANNPLSVNEFRVEYPDGSVAFYGGTNCSSITTWALRYWQNAQGLRINYTYTLENNNLRLASINYGSVGTTEGINKIQFTYKTRQLSELVYVDGFGIVNNTILSSIAITGNGVAFRNYILGYDLAALGYERLTSMTEKSGDSSKSYNSTIFSYIESVVADQITYTGVTDLSSPSSVAINKPNTISGDFDGDGELDYMLYNTFSPFTNYQLFTHINDGVTQATGINFTIPNVPLMNISSVKTIKCLQGDINSGYKLLNRDAWCGSGFVDNGDGTLKARFYNIYSRESDSNPVKLEYTKSYVFPVENFETGYYVDYFGDFNGDGLSDVMQFPMASVENIAFRKINYINLDKRIENNFVKPSSFTIEAILPQKDIIKVADVNGDGKSDLVVFRAAPFNKITVYTLDSNDNIVQLFEMNYTFLTVPVSDPNPGYATIDKTSVLDGDFNGDGKADFVFPASSSGVEKILFLSTGNSFIVEPFTLKEYAISKTAMAVDQNNDGKTDILSYGAILNNKMRITFMNRISSGKWKEFSVVFDNINHAYDNLTPVSIKPSNLFDKMPELALLGSDNKIFHFRFQNHFSNQKLLKQITLGNGVKEIITYSPLTKTNNIYTSASQLIEYPYIDVLPSLGLQVVSKIEKQSSTVYKKQLFSYFGAVSNSEGLGFLGFQATSSTNWYNNDNPPIYTISKYDIANRGALSVRYTTLNFSPSDLNNKSDIIFPTNLIVNTPIQKQQDYKASNSIILKPGFSASGVNGVVVAKVVSPLSQANSSSNTGYITKNVMSYDQELLPNKVFKIRNMQSATLNKLENTSSETSVTYDTYNNPLQSITVVKQAGATQQTTTSTITYDPIASNPYVLGRPKSKTESITANGDTMTTEEQFLYQNNLLSQIEKKGTNTNSIIEKNEYDIYGNITKKTVSAPNSAPSLAPRVVDYEYDTSTHRFLTKKTDIERLVTTYTYDMSNGLLKTETLPSKSSFPLITTFGYDAWGKTINKTDYLGTIETYVYTNTSSGGVYKTINASTIGSSSTVLIDDLGRTIRESVQDIGGNLSYVDSSYDIYDRTTFKSKPYSADGINAWNNTEFDIYGRLKKVSLKSSDGSGKVVDYDYDGLKVTEREGSKSKEIVKNALGNVVSVTENFGGKITYDYFANGNLKSTNCNKAVTSIEQDGWGRKTKLDDSSAGIRWYAYNDFGEIISEEVENKGVTEYELDNAGKIKFKTIKKANKIDILSKNTYTYDVTTKLLTSIRFDDSVNGFYSLNNYLYDDYYRVKFTEEIADKRAKFSKTITYDAFGRPATEFYSATNTIDAKKSEKLIQNFYKNGYLWKIVDGVDITKILWQTNTVNPQGQLLTAKLGNGIAITNTYDAAGFPTQIKHDLGNTNIMTLGTVFEPVKGNLSSRTNNMFGSWNETFTYDDSDRLKNYNDVTGQQTQNYNDNGSISNNNIGSYAYKISGKPFQNSSTVLSNPSAPLTYYTGRDQNITYNLFKSPITITEQNKENIDFEYNAFDSRSAMYYGGLQDKNLRPYRKYYSADGSMEIKYKTTTPSSVEFITYIGGDAYTAPLLLKSDGTTQNYFYLHRDYQGTIVAITNSTGVVVEKRLFDAWGSLIKYANSSGITTVPTTSAGLFIDRGYTGHEHLLGVGLINMNGRIYDPKLHRFLQPDNNIQDPFNTQNYNRYSYVMNNPTKYTDPSGESWGDVLGFFFSFYVHGGAASGGEANPLKWDSNAWLNGLSGATSNVVSFEASRMGNSYIDNYNKTPELGVSASSEGNGGGKIHSYVSTSNSDIHSPTQHSSLGYNWTYLSQGKPLSRFIYVVGNTISTFGQWIMGRGVGDSSMRNLDGSSTSTDEAVMAFVNIGSLSTFGISSATVSIADGSFYSVAYETRLSSDLFPSKGVYSHFKAANTALDNAIASDVTFANSMKELGISVPKTNAGTVGGGKIQNWVWHHSTEEGIMQLVPQVQHTNGSIFWQTLHPGGRGGMSIWGGGYRR